MKQRGDASAPKPDYASLVSALEVVDSEAKRALQKGLAARAFFLGLFNLLASAYLIGAYPHSFWVVYAAQSLLILGYRLSVDARKTNPTTLLYFLDFCWVCNFFLSAISMFVLLRVLDERFNSSSSNSVPDIDLAARFPTIGRMFCLFATGPLGWSVIALKNALVLHDIELYSTCFVHLWPALTTLSVRYDGGAAVRAAYPGHFDGLVGFTEEGAMGSSVSELVWLGFASYLLWWVPFTAWMLLHGRFQSPQRTGRDTVYLNLVNNNRAVARVLGIRRRGSGGEDISIVDQASKIGPVVKYMGLHAVLCAVTFFLSALCYLSVALHQAFCIVLVVTALSNAAKRYKWMLTQRYVRALQRHIDTLFPDRKKKLRRSNSNPKKMAHAD